MKTKFRKVVGYSWSVLPTYGIIGPKTVYRIHDKDSDLGFRLILKKLK